MPYSIEKRGSEYQVVTTDTGKVHGTFKSKRQARRQLKALYANANPKEEHPFFKP